MFTAAQPINVTKSASDKKCLRKLKGDTEFRNRAHTINILNQPQLEGGTSGGLSDRADETS